MGTETTQKDMLLTEKEAIEQRRCQKCGGNKFSVQFSGNAQFTAEPKKKGEPCPPMIFFGKNWETETVDEMECRDCKHEIPESQFEKWMW